MNPPRAGAHLQAVLHHCDDSVARYNGYVRCSAIITVHILVHQGVLFVAFILLSGLDGWFLPLLIFLVVLTVLTSKLGFVHVGVSLDTLLLLQPG